MIKEHLMRSYANSKKLAYHCRAANAFYGPIFECLDQIIDTVGQQQMKAKVKSTTKASVPMNVASYAHSFACMSGHFFPQSYLQSISYSNRTFSGSVTYK